MRKKSDPMVRVIRDPRDATRDYWISFYLAEQLFEAGQLLWNETNKCYCHR